MLSNLKISIAKRRIAAAIERTFSGSENQIQRIGVILDSEKEHLRESFHSLKEDLGLPETHLQIVVCENGGNTADIFQGLVFSRKDLSWDGKIRNGEITAFVRQEMDMLICYTETDNKLAALLVSVTNAHLKVGRREEISSAGLFDLIISTGFEDVELFIAELKKYLKILNKTK